MTYSYDARERATDYRKTIPGGTDTAITYTLDEPTHLDPSVTRAGNITTQQTVAGGKTTTVVNHYEGNQLDNVTTTVTENGASAPSLTAYYAYDDLGNLDCVTTDPAARPARSQTTRPPPLRSWPTTPTTRSIALRPTGPMRAGPRPTRRPTPTTPWTGSPRSTSSTRALGTRPPGCPTSGSPGPRARRPSRPQARSPRPTPTTPLGLRLAMTRNPDATDPQHYTYGYDVHGSVSQLLGNDGQTSAPYGYDPYGEEDTTLTKGDPATNDVNITSPFRYSAKRYDTGSETIDMGARRFSPDTSRFLQAPTSTGGAVRPVAHDRPPDPEPLCPGRGQPGQLRGGRRPRRLLQRLWNRAQPATGEGNGRNAAGAKTHRKRRASELLVESSWRTRSLRSPPRANGQGFKSWSDERLWDRKMSHTWTNGVPAACRTSPTGDQAVPLTVGCTKQTASKGLAREIAGTTMKMGKREREPNLARNSLAAPLFAGDVEPQSAVRSHWLPFPIPLPVTQAVSGYPAGQR